MSLRWTPETKLGWIQVGLLAGIFAVALLIAILIPASKDLPIPLNAQTEPEPRHRPKSNDALQDAKSAIYLLWIEARRAGDEDLAKRCEDCTLTLGERHFIKKADR